MTQTQRAIAIGGTRDGQFIYGYNNQPTVSMAVRVPLGLPTYGPNIDVSDVSVRTERYYYETLTFRDLGKENETLSFWRISHMTPFDAVCIVFNKYAKIV